MNFIDVIVLSVVEGLTEFLPVSSTGHLILTAEILNITQTEFVKSFEIFIQLGAILAVVLLYGKALIRNFKLNLLILTAFLPAAATGIIFYGIIKEYFLGNSLITVISLFTGGIILILTELAMKQKTQDIKKPENTGFKNSLIIGVCQSLAVIPGVSRSGASIIGGMLAGLDRRTATEFSFLLAVPTMAGATALDLVKSEFRFSPDELVLLATGFILSFLSSLLAVRLLIKFVRNHSFIHFGIYRIILAIVFYIFFLT